MAAARSIRPSAGERGAEMTSGLGWDGKLRHPSKMEQEEEENGEATDEEDDEEEEEEPLRQTRRGETQVVEGEGIDPDEDLLDGYEPDTTEIDLVHCRITSIPALRLERFPKTERLCLRQNQISTIEFPPELATSVQELDLYDNLISHIKGLDDFTALTSLDLSFNKIKHIKRLSHLSRLTDLYFVQNRISTIENLHHPHLKNLELGANRIRTIENLDNLPSLEQLWLGKNKIDRLQNLDRLPSLSLLSIQSNRLTSLSGLSLPSLTELYISHNAITDLAPLASLPNLRVLDISNNPVASLAGVAPLTKLEELWASYCALEDFEEVARECKEMKELETVYFEGNPLQKRQPVLYRGKVRLAIPWVKQIDASKC
ncbi:L domain-like protein [Eremomyces bilateralis CBS 781.70]|uniref:L domain-like protein n=1 Tax=Eremomyces bilateralis CBS 781.70 TaxID=1392243 RepID=A0A6G1FRI3_9PEZI|nr:L domain-like protein [Eremomyces bilateralis CBS 781.70]KAF1808272.1 L domain-like protein [Eremomyces bilateralis CBS 781.70]